MNYYNLRKFCVAPMMGYTTPHARKLYRILSKKAFLFTEMIPSNTLIHSLKRDLIIENLNQNPIALQVGGSNYKDLTKCAKIAKYYNYDEVNLNVGCPSKAVQKGDFGACLMNKKDLVRDCLKAMLDTTDIEVTMKCRIGLNDQNTYDFFRKFIDEIIKSGIKIVYVHARNAMLNGLSPKNNRSIPPLKYDFVSKIKNEYPHISFILNGGINSLADAYKFLEKYDGVMLGRLIQSNPFSLIDVDKIFFNDHEKKKQNQIIIHEYFEYVNQKINEESIFRLLSPLLHIFFGIPNGKKFKEKINNKMKNCKIDELQSLFLELVI